MNKKSCIWEDKVLLFETKNKIMYSSSCVTNQELNNLSQETDIADKDHTCLVKNCNFLTFANKNDPFRNLWMLFFDPKRTKLHQNFDV